MPHLNSEHLRLNLAPVSKQRKGQRVQQSSVVHGVPRMLYVVRHS
jgi:hypothetical protein